LDISVRADLCVYRFRVGRSTAAEVGVFEQGRAADEISGVAAQHNLSVHENDGFIGYLERQSDVLPDEYDDGTIVVGAMTALSMHRPTEEG
jgi:hypothetical protein